MLFDSRPRHLDAPTGCTTHRVIPGRTGDLLYRVYTPGVGEGPYPALVYFHFGGFVISNRIEYDRSCRALAHMAGAVVVTVAYRHDSQPTILGSVEVVAAAYRWLAEHVGGLDLDPARIAVGGDSVGGTAAAVLAQIARDQGHEAPVHRLHAYPMSERVFDDPEDADRDAVGAGTSEQMTWFWGAN